jgi:U3 small nucleolar RNA-associated protein 3
MSKRPYKKLRETKLDKHSKKVVKEDSSGPSDSEIYDEVDAFHQQRDKQILGDTLKDKKKKYVEQEVLGVVPSDESSDEEEYDDDSDDSVDERLGKDKHGEAAIKSRDAWGKEKLKFYGSHADKDYGGWDSDEAEALELEEEDAVSRQKKLDAGIAAVDFEGLLASDNDEEEMEVVASKKPSKKADDKKSKSSLQSLNKKEEIDYMLKHSQTFAQFQAEYNQRKAQFEELKPTLDSILSSMKDRPCSFTQQIKAIVAAYTQYLQSYLMFFYLKSTTPLETFKTVENHPVLDDIMKQYPVMKQIDDFIENNYRRLLKVADRLKDDPSYADVIAFPEPSKKKRRMEEQASAEPMEEDIGNIFAQMASGKVKKDKKVGAFGPALDDPDASEDGQKRKITYEMQKNKGLTVNRKKGASHSRTKKRKQFKKATHVRRSQVPDVQREINKYSGETRGIRASLVKSIKLKA